MSSVCFFVHDASGRIVRSGLCRDVDVEHQAIEAGEVAVQTEERVDPALFYVLDGVVTPRPVSNINSYTNGRVIGLTGVPLASIVRLAGPAYRTEVMDDASGQIEFAVPASGAYTIDVESFPALRYAGSVTVT